MAEIISLSSSAIDLLSFSLRIITRTGDARGGASGFAELLEKHADEVRNTKSLLECIQNEPSLRSPNVQDTVITIQEAAQSLHAFLAAQKATLEKGGVQKYLRQLFKNSQDLERLDEIMNHLARAKIDLGAKIQVINAGLMGSLRGGVRSNTDALEALNGRVKELLGEDHVLRVAAHDGGPSGVERGVMALGHNDIVAMAASYTSDLASTTGSSQPGSRGKVRIVTNNIALKRSLQVNVPVERDDWADMDVVAVYGNVADEDSVQFNYPINASDFLAALRIKYGRE